MKKSTAHLLRLLEAHDLDQIRHILAVWRTTPDEWGIALCEAAAANQAEAVELLLEHGADVNFVGEDDHSPVERAAANGHVAMAAALRARGAVARSCYPGHLGQSLLRATGQDTPAFDLLLSLNPDVDYQLDEEGSTPLMRAAEASNPEQVARLLKCGADPTITGYDGCALRVALERQYYYPNVRKRSERRRRSKEVIRLLTEVRPDASAVIDQWRRDFTAARRRWKRSLRRLFFMMRDYRGDQLYREVVEPFIPYGRQALKALSSHRHLDATHLPPEVDHEDLVDWYAISRVNDALLLCFQEGDDLNWNAPFQSVEYQAYRQSENTPYWAEGAISREQYLDFFIGIGFDLMDDKPYHPFFHEVVEVVEDESLGQEVVIERVYWPGLMFGEMLFSRSGVRVRCSRNVMKKEIAEGSRLDWTYWRRRRETIDGSVGFGHNSQWNTRFRRDYHHAGVFHYNVDEDEYLDEATLTSRAQEFGDDLAPLSVYIEVLTNRCRVITETDKDTCSFYRYCQTAVS